ncbi:MAG TPA: hypothetical protein VGP70_14350 [Actinomadura sp.]|nr:hypothetical protein [Actinomadura sp.]
MNHVQASGHVRRAAPYSPYDNPVERVWDTFTGADRQGRKP